MNRVTRCTANVTRAMVLLGALHAGIAVVARAAGDPQGAAARPAARPGRLVTVETG